jgi:hypothetical protein
MADVFCECRNVMFSHARSKGEGCVRCSAAGATDIVFHIRNGVPRLQHGREHERCGMPPLGGGGSALGARACAVLSTYTGYESSYPSSHEALSWKKFPLLTGVLRAI